MEGWIKLHRQITDNKLWFCERFTKAQAWIDLLLLANHNPSTFFVRGNEVILKRSQLGYAITTLAKRWKWNERTVNKFLSMLQKDGMIHYRKSSITTVITIRNYGLYQDNTGQNTEQSKNRIQTNKNDKNEKKRYNDDFEKFWSIFPNSELGNKGSKKKAYNQFRKLNPDQNTLQILIDAVNKQAEHKRTLKIKGEFCPSYPHVERWLRDERWTDEIPELQTTIKLRPPE